MTISAQVIDTIVEWIDDNLHQPLRIDDIARHAGYSKWHLQRLFLQYKGESLGRYIRERKLLLAARDLRDTDQRVCDICLKYGFPIRNRPLPASSPGPSICRRGAYRKSRRAPEARPSGLAFEQKPATPHQRSTRYSMAPSAKNPQTKQHRTKAGFEIIIWNVSTSFCASVRPSDGAGNSRQESRARSRIPGVFILPSNSAGISYNQG